MGLFNKIKDILFEEVDDDEKTTSKKEVSSEIKKPIAEKIEPQRKVEPQVEKFKEQPKNETVYREERSFNTVEKPKVEKSFSFPDFDEEEFSSMSRVQKQKTPTNVLEYEKKKRIEKRTDYGRYEKVEKTEVVERRKFKPSPIISPVYGILNEDYKPEDIKNKTEEKDTNLDFNSVRKKAFGEETEKQPKTTYYEESVTVKLKENEEEKKQKVKTIDELLEDTSDLTIDINESDDNLPNNNDYEKVDEELIDLTPEVHEKKSIQEKVEDDDTLENDLFDLIDSMYDNREDGDE